MAMFLGDKGEISDQAYESKFWDAISSDLIVLAKYCYRNARNKFPLDKFPIVRNITRPSVKFLLEHGVEGPNIVMTAVVTADTDVEAVELVIKE
jgi:hypothetical protein